MKSFSRRAAAVVLIAALSLPSVALASPLYERDRGRDPNPIIRIIKKIQKIFGVTSNDDVPVPPKP